MSLELHEITQQTRIDGELDGRYLTMLQVKELAQVPDATHILRVNYYRRNRPEALEHGLRVNGMVLCKDVSNKTPCIITAAVRREEPPNESNSEIV